jgi:hypothetical protein
VVIGYGLVQLNGTNAAGLAIFDLRQNNILVSETSVPATLPLTSGRIYAEVPGAVDAGLAIANPNNSSAINQKRVLLLMSDGFDTKSRITADQAEDLLKSSNVLLYAISIDDDDNDTVTRRRTRYHIYEYMLNKLTGAAGGRVIRLYTGRNYDLRTFSELLLGELHLGYTIGYYPAALSTTAMSRNIEVRVEKAGARVLTESSQLQRRTE